MTEFQVLFALSEDAFPPVEDGCIQVWPHDPTWNDFRFNFKAQAKWIWQVPDGEREMRAFLFVLPWPLGTQKKFQDWVKANLGAERTYLAASQASSGFLSILGSEDDYQTIVARAEGNKVLIDRMLAPLHDVVHMRWRLLELEKLEEFVASEAVAKGVFRSALTYQAWHGGIHVLKGTKPAHLDSRRSFELSAFLAGFGAPHVLAVAYGAPPPLFDRCHALIGRNGVGKSRLLRELVLALAHRIDAAEPGPFGLTGSESIDSATLTPNDFEVARVIALSWDAESVFPRDSRLDSPFQFQHFDMVSPTDVMPHNASSPEMSETPTSVLVQIIMTGQRVGDAFEALKVSLSPVLDVDWVAIPLRPRGGGQVEWIAASKLRKGGEEKQLERLARVEFSLDPKVITSSGEAVPLSSGQRVFLSFAIRCVGRVTSGSLLLLDEPETHLHPNLISEFMRLLARILEATESVALLATHSPYVVRELPSRCVHIIQVDEKRAPVIRSAYLRTLGASIDQLSVDIFGDEESNKLNAETAERIVELGLSFEEVRARFGREISSDLLSHVRDLMESKTDSADPA